MLDKLSNLDGLIFRRQEVKFKLFLHFTNKIKWVFMVGFILGFMMCQKLVYHCYNWLIVYRGYLFMSVFLGSPLFGKSLTPTCQYLYVIMVKTSWHFENHKKGFFSKNLNISLTDNVRRSKFQYLVLLGKSFECGTLNFKNFVVSEVTIEKCRFTLRDIYDISIYFCPIFFEVTTET